MESILSFTVKRYVRTKCAPDFKAPWSFMWRRKGIQSVGPYYEYHWDWPDKKSGHNVISPKFGDTPTQKNHPRFRMLSFRYSGCQPIGYTDPGKDKFFIVPEMVPEIVAPDLTNFELKPYVSYQCKENEVKEEPFTAKKLFDACYAQNVKRAWKDGYYKNHTSIFERQELEES